MEKWESISNPVLLRVSTYCYTTRTLVIDVLLDMTWDTVHNVGLEIRSKKGRKILMLLQIWSQGVMGYKTTNLTSNANKNECLLSERLKKQSNQISKPGYLLSCNYLLLYNTVWSRRAFKCLRSCRKNARETLIFLQIQIKPVKTSPSKLQAGQCLQGFWPPEILQALP